MAAVSLTCYMYSPYVVYDEHVDSRISYYSSCSCL